MDLRGQARADQIVAVLREAERPLHTFEMLPLLGSPVKNGWGVIATVALLDEMRLRRLLATARPACCGLHALWMLPADV